VSGASTVATPERRRERRIDIRLPIHVRGKDAEGAEFEERTSSENICRGGVAFVTRRKLGHGTTLEIRIPLPASTGTAEDEFSTVGRVVHVKNVDADAGLYIGVEFTGPRFRRIFQSEASH
jgi:c-di-GMP-binding flagellar brake protein YcgR